MQVVCMVSPVLCVDRAIVYNSFVRHKPPQHFTVEKNSIIEIIFLSKKTFENQLVKLTWQWCSGILTASPVVGIKQRI